MLEPIVKTIEVPCSKETAFNVFINEMHSWWPLDRFTTSALGGSVAKSIRVEAKPGGEIVEIGPDDTEHPWGTINTYDPYDYISMDFHVPHPSEIDINRSLVEVRFITIDDGQTRVELTQSNWEAFGEMAQMVFGGYGQAWNLIFAQAYKAACGD